MNRCLKIKELSFHTILISNPTDMLSTIDPEKMLEINSRMRSDDMRFSEDPEETSSTSTCAKRPVTEKVTNENDKISVVCSCKVCLRAFIPPPIQEHTLNSTQSYIINYSLSQIQDNKQQLTLLILGGPGTGKTFLVNRLAERLQLINYQMQAAAYMGAAASLVLGGVTLHKLLALL